MSEPTYLDDMLQNNLSPPVLKLMQQAGNMAAEQGFKLYLVGGIVRDLLLDYPLENDYDLVVTGDAGHFAVLLQEQIGGRLTLFPRFLTAAIKLDAGTRFDLSTARREFYPKPAALPRVEAASLKQDLCRRDFTINALACSLLPAEMGLLYDYYNGCYDLQQKLVRIFHPASFFDDPLRIIRAIRFEQRYSFKIEAMTLACLLKAANEETLALVDSQRLAREVRYIDREPYPAKVFMRLEELGVKIGF